MSNKVPKKYIPSKPEHKEVLIRYAADRLVNGEKVGNVAKELVEKFKILEKESLMILKDCKDVLRNQLQIKVPFILSNHIERYEYLYEKFVIINRTDLINIALQQKEELLNLKSLLTERLQEDLTKEVIENKFLFDKLDENQKKRFRELVLKVSS